MTDDLKKDTPAEKKTGSRSAPGTTVIITVVTALLTTLIAPYLLESLKEKQARRDKEAEKQDRIVSTQFEIVESSNEIYWRYRQAANFVIFDFQNGQPDGALWESHWSNFQKASETANSQLPIQAFRGRMYFGSNEVYERLLKIPRKIFDGVDRDISLQRNKDVVPNAEKGKSTDAWQAIQTELTEVNPVVEENLNYVFGQIGTETKR